VTAKSDKDQLAREVADLRIAFDLALSDKRKYPVGEFNAFLESVRRYIKVTAGDSMVHKSVVQAVNGLREFLQAERKRIPGISCLKPTDLNASFSMATILTSMATSLPGYKPASQLSRSTGMISLPFPTRTKPLTRRTPEA
jgi:hypothetical protein